MSAIKMTLGASALVALSLAFIPAGTGNAQQAAGAPDPALVAKGARLWADNCGRCHNIRPASEFTDEGWHSVVNHMRVRASLPGDQAEAIKAFLQSGN
ncbi:MAG: cytochrome c [Alphaproteobacteria bacterium]|nr:MAG: cytochrome c [Alphaproteobacteria bacterium]